MTKDDLARWLAEELEPEPEDDGECEFHCGCAWERSVQRLWYRRPAITFSSLEEPWDWEPAPLDGNFAAAVIAAMKRGAAGRQDLRWTKFVKAIQELSECEVSNGWLSLSGLLWRITPEMVCLAARAALEGGGE